MSKKRNFLIPSAIFLAASFLIILGVYAVCHLYLQKISRETMQNWLQSEKIDIQEHNLLSAITKNQRVLLSSEFIKGVALFDLNLEKQSTLIEFGASISADQTKRMATHDLQSEDVGIFSQIVCAKIPGQESMVLAFKIEAQFLKQLLLFVSLGFILLFVLFLSMIFILERRSTRQREVFLKNALQQFLNDGKSFQELETEFPQLLAWWRKSKAEFELTQEKLIQSREQVLFAAKARRVAHDIRLPMKVLERVPARVSSGEINFDEAKAIIAQVVGRLGGVTTDLVGPQQSTTTTHPIPDSSRQIDELQKIDVAASLEKLIIEKRSLYGYLRDVQIDLVVRPDSIRTLAVNEVELIRNISNLIDNAVDAIGLSGRVEVELSSNKNILKIAVKDNGCGIPSEILGQIGLTQRSFKSKGTGTGVFYSRIFARSVGGDLFIESVQGEGSTFSLVLPLHESVFILPKTLPLVYVDDDVMAHSFWNCFLDDSGIKNISSLPFSSSKEYERWSQSGQAHVLFSDFDLREEGFDGLDLIGKVVSEPLVRKSYLVTNSYDDMTLVRRAASAGIKIIPKNKLHEFAIELH